MYYNLLYEIIMLLYLSILEALDVVSQVAEHANDGMRDGVR